MLEGKQEKKQQLSQQMEELKTRIDQERKQMNQVYLTEDKETVYRKNQDMDRLIEEYLELKEQLEAL